MTDTARWALPLLEAGQAQKEMTHNEALQRLDLLAQASVEVVGLDTAPIAPGVGQCWIVGLTPTGAWTGQARTLAGWTQGGWRFVEPGEGMRAWSTADGCAATFSGGEWRVGRLGATELRVNGTRVVGAQRPAIAAPAGGTAADAEARATLGEVLAALRAHGLIAS